MGVEILTPEMIKGAQYTETVYGVPASITLAQIVQESSGRGGGLSGLASAPNYNLFGVKAFSSWKGETVTLRNGPMDTEKYSTYRKYNNYGESIIDHAKVLQNSRYTQYTNSATNYKDYAYGIQKGGYAGDPNYANSLINIIEKNNLTQYDKAGVTTFSGGTDTVPYVNNSNVTYNYEELGFWDEKANDIASTVIQVCAVAFLVIVAVVFFLKSFEILPSGKQVMQATGKILDIAI